MKKGKFEQTNQKKRHGKLVFIIFLLLAVAGIAWLAIRFLPKELNSDTEITTDAAGVETETQGINAYAPTNTELSYEFIDHTIFSEYLTNGIFKCGSDFEPGDYYIMSIYMAEALYDVSNSPSNFTWSDHRVMRKVSVEKGQYVNLTAGALLVPVEEVDENAWEKYGVFLVGRDLPEGEYKVVSITDEYCSELDNISGICGAYQICGKDPTNEPVECSPLFNNQTYVSLENGQYIIINNAHLTLDGAETEESVFTTETPAISAVESAYLDACSLTEEKLESRYSSFLDKTSFYYDGLIIQPEDVEWLQTSWNTEKSLNQGALYRSMAMYLEGFSMKVNNGSDYSELLCGQPWVDRESFAPYVENASTFIITDPENQLKAIMKKFQSLSSVTGDYDFNYGAFGEYSLDIPNLTICAKEMQVSEKMLGYIFAFLQEYAPIITFDGNTCHLEYISLAMEAPEPIAESDFIAELPSEGTTEDMLGLLKRYGNGRFQFFYFDATYDESKESVIKTDRGIIIGQSKDEVIEAYGEGEEAEFNTDDNQVYAGLLMTNPQHAAVMRTQCSTYITYTYDDIADIEFYFDEYDYLTWIVFSIL